MKISKHENRKITYFAALVLIYFRLMKGRATFFRPEAIVESDDVNLQSVHQSFFERPVCGASYCKQRKAQLISKYKQHFIINEF